MASVAENFAGICVDQLRPLREVRKGYTGFIEGDVLLAKITPCMENGKGGLVPWLPRRFAFGSTEFHVLRPSVAISGPWLAHFLSQLTADLKVPFQLQEGQRVDDTPVHEALPIR